MSRTYRLTLTVTIEPEHAAYDDPEWVADAASGTLTNEYDLECVYGVIELVEGSASEGQ